ncbi:MAG: DNA repair protein RecN [Bernardetiaceae bacterium]
MLRSLYIKNYILIQELRLDPLPSLNIITGETGAGKSILLGALGLLGGQRADTKVLWDSDQKCIIEGTFDIRAYPLEGLFEALGVDYEPECVIRRQITPAGRSRAFINDTPVTLDNLRKITLLLMDVHSQHDTLQLGSPEFQLGILDAYAQNRGLLQAYQEAYAAFRKAESRFQKLKQDVRELQKEYDFNTFQLQELQKIPLDELDQEAMEQELERIENIEHIGEQLTLAQNILSRDELQSVEAMLREAIAALQKLTKFSPQYSDLHGRLESAAIELKDIDSQIESEIEELFVDEERAQWLKQQISALYHLQKKHHLQSVPALIALRDDLLEKVSRLENFDQELATAEAAREVARKALQTAGMDLSQSRQAVIAAIETEVQQLLTDLGMKNARLSVAFQDSPTPHILGLDQTQFLFSANKGISPEPLQEVASGGEFSRLMLVIKYILADKVSLPTIIFDEIDTGISGEIAIKVGQMMRQMATRHQVITISHQPQVAASGDAHYFVYKDQDKERVTSHIRLLNREERIREIAQMIGGSSPSESTYRSARELLHG